MGGLEQAGAPAREPRDDEGRITCSWCGSTDVERIGEFGPGSLIYHEGARYEVVRVQLPRDTGEAGGGAITDTAKRCESCGKDPVASTRYDVSW